MTEIKKVAVLGSGVMGAGIAGLMAVLLPVMGWSQSPPPWDDAWRHCDAAAECEVVKNECYAWTSVNAKHKAEAQEHFNYLRPRVNCVAPKPTPQPPARCEDNQCVIG